jgi:anti-sigma regulatory factor (Ser/Thr protein kinase)
LIGAEAASDDIALLAVRFTDAGPETALELEMPAEPSSLAHIRVAVRRWLREAGAADAAINDLLVAVGEASSNSVEHAYGPSGGTVFVRVELRGTDAIVEVRDTGRWREPRGSGRGRGTLIMQTTTDEFRVERGPDGSTIHLRRRIDR